MRWQYYIVSLGSFKASARLAVALGPLGSQGWELVGVYDKATNWLVGFEKGFAMLKRPVPEGSPDPDTWVFEARATDFHLPERLSPSTKMPPL